MSDVFSWTYQGQTLLNHFQVVFIPTTGKPAARGCSQQPERIALFTKLTARGYFATQRFPFFNQTGSPREEPSYVQICFPCLKPIEKHQLLCRTTSGPRSLLSSRGLFPVYQFFGFDRGRITKGTVRSVSIRWLDGHQEEKCCSL